MKENNSIRKLLLAGALALLNTTAHFLPFERMALAPDDYASLVRSQDHASFLRYAERPINYFFLHAQSLIIGDNATYGFILLLASSIFLLVCVFLLLDELLKDTVSAFFAAAIFCLVPNTLEIYHTAIFANMNFVFSAYIICLLFYLKYLESGKVSLLVSSLAFYAVGIFWYEVGFFTPLIMLVAALLRKKEKIISWFLFLPLSAIYLVYRLSGAFGISSRPDELHAASLSMIPFNFTELLHHYIGRYIARSIIYGLYRFPSIEGPWLPLISFLNIAVVLFLVILIRRYGIKRPSKDSLIMACAIFIFWLSPILLNSGGGIGGRHLALPSVGIAVFGVWLFSLIRCGRAILAGIILFFLLAVSQGNAWTQAVACRINGSVYEFLKENRPELRKASIVVFDARSFADNIPFTLVSRDFNVLNTYYGAQAFEDWGLTSMIKLASGDSNKTVYVASISPKISDDKISFSIADYLGYRSTKNAVMTLNRRGVLVIGFNDVFASGFRNGRPGRCK